MEVDRDRNTGGMDLEHNMDVLLRFLREMLNELLRMQTQLLHLRLNNGGNADIFLNIARLTIRAV